MQKFTFKWNTHLYVSLFLSVCCSAHPSAPYLRNRTLCDHNFFYTCVKWWYLQGLFHFYEILIFWAVSGGGGGGGGKKQPKMKNINYIRRTQYLRNNIAYDHHIWQTCLKWWYIHVSFHFLCLKKIMCSLESLVVILRHHCVAIL